MRDPLVDELRDLAGWLDVPEPADQRAAVRARLSAVPPRRSRPPRRWIAAVAAAVVAGTVAVVPPARAAVVDAVGEVLRFAGVEIRDRDQRPVQLPATPSPLPSVRSAALDEARRLAKFPVLAPTVLGVPEDVQLADPAPDGAPRVVSLIYRGATVRIDQFDGQMQGHFMKSANNAHYVDVRGEFAIWVPEPHPVVYVDRFGAERTEAARLAGPTLIWTDGAATYRIEGLPDLAAARGVADSMT